MISRGTPSQLGSPLGDGAFRRRDGVDREGFGLYKDWWLEIEEGFA